MSIASASLRFHEVKINQLDKSQQLIKSLVKECTVACDEPEAKPSSPLPIRDSEQPDRECLLSVPLTKDVGGGDLQVFSARKMPVRRQVPKSSSSGEGALLLFVISSCNKCLHIIHAKILCSATHYLQNLKRSETEVSSSIYIFFSLHLLALSILHLGDQAGEQKPAKKPKVCNFVGICLHA
jgi:hypothetical protein